MTEQPIPSPATIRRRHPRALRTTAALGVAPAVALLLACTSPPPDSSGISELSRFAENTGVSARALENVTACDVDAVCYLRIEFADTAIAAVYGWGERAVPECEIPREVSDAAFQVEAGDIVEVVISRCDGEGRYLRQIARDTPGL